MGNLPLFKSEPPKKAYFIAMLAVRDPVGFKRYILNYERIVGKFRGKAVVKNTDLSSKDSFTDHAEGFQRCIVVEFINVNDARNWYHGLEYRNILSSRADNTSGPVIIATVDTDREDEHKALVVAFARAPPVPHEEEGPMLGPSLNPYHGRVVLNCALKPDRAFTNKAIECEGKTGEEYDYCLVLSFPDMEQAKEWKASGTYVHLDGPLVALPVA